MREAHQAPALLIGHSLGGAAVLAVASEIAGIEAVVTIAAPSDPAHVTGLFADHIEQIQAEGEAQVQLSGRPFRIKRQFLEDVAEQRLTEKIAHMNTALLVMHAPEDATVGIVNANHIFRAAKHPKSYISLAGADHLLTRKSDAVYAADIIAAWSERYLGPGGDKGPLERVGGVTRLRCNARPA